MTTEFTNFEEPDIFNYSFYFKRGLSFHLPCAFLKVIKRKFGGNENLPFFKIPTQKVQS